MNKERKVIESNAIVVFDRNVYANELNEFFKEFKGDIIINGDLIFDVDLIIQCDNLYVIGEITLMLTLLWPDILVEGNMYVYGDIDCYKINVNGSICCMKRINSFEINVSENVYAKDGIGTNGYDINVGGDLVCEDDIKAAEIIVLQKMYVTGTIEADSISVG